MTAFKPSLPDALRRIRKARGLSQEAFSDVSSRTYLSTLECIDPLKSCTGVIVEGNDDEYPDGRRYQTLDGQA